MEQRHVHHREAVVDLVRGDPGALEQGPGEGIGQHPQAKLVIDHRGRLPGDVRRAHGVERVGAEGEGGRQPVVADQRAEDLGVRQVMAMQDVRAEFLDLFADQGRIGDLLEGDVAPVGRVRVGQADQRDVVVGLQGLDLVLDVGLGHLRKIAHQVHDPRPGHRSRRNARAQQAAQQVHGAITAWDVRGRNGSRSMSPV